MILSGPAILLTRQPESMSTDEFIVLVHVEEYQQWSKGDHTIPLADVVDGTLTPAQAHS